MGKENRLKQAALYRIHAGYIGSCMDALGSEFLDAETVLAILRAPIFDPDGVVRSTLNLRLIVAAYPKR